MVNPKSLVLSLSTHWDIIEHLARIAREMPVFRDDEILAEIGKLSPAMAVEKRATVLRSLCSSQVLQQLPRSTSVQLNPLVLEFIHGLTREHELGLSSVLQARIEAIHGATLDLNKGMENSDMDMLRKAATRLSGLFRQITQQLDQDRHAILELAEQAKSADSTMPIARRYRAVLEAYDQYVEPMNQMMDTGPAGTFYRYLETAEQALDHTVQQLKVRGALYSHHLQLRHVAYQAKELRRLGRVVAKQCADTLLPLREEIRQHNTLSAAISSLLGQVRKKGLTRALRQITTAPALPVWRSERQRRVSVGNEVLTIMSEARAFTPEVQTFPEELEVQPNALAEWIEETALRAHLKSSLPVPNLLEWLRQHYSQLPDAVLLRLYHELVRSSEWQTSQADTESIITLRTVGVRHYPHAVRIQ